MTGGYRDELRAEAPTTPAWCEIDPRALSPDARARLEARLAEEKIGGRPAPTEAERAALLIYAATCVLAAGALAFFAVGIVGVGPDWPMSAALAYGILAALFVHCMLAWRAAGREPVPLVDGRVLVISGLVEAVGEHLRIAPADRIRNLRAEADGRIEVTLDDGRSFDVMARGAASARAAVEAVSERAEKIRRARQQQSTRDLEALELVTRPDLESALAPPLPRRRAPGAMALTCASGLLVAALAYALVLPYFALAWTPPSASVVRWTSVGRSYGPLPWVHQRARAGIESRRAQVREATLARVASGYRDAIEALLLWLDAHDESLVGVEIRQPSAEACDQLSATLPPDTAPVAFVPSSGSLPPGVDAIAGNLGAALQAPHDVLQFVRGARGPRVVVDVEARVASVLSFGSTRVAALELSLTPTIELPDQAPIPLGDTIVVAPAREGSLRWRLEDGADGPDWSGVCQARQLDRAILVGAYRLGRRVVGRDDRY